MIGCSTQDSPTGNVNNVNSYTIKAESNGDPVAGAKVIAIIDEDSEIIVECNNNGIATIETSIPLSQICCVSLGKSGVIDVSESGDFVVRMNEIPSKSLNKTATTGTFGVYSTDGDGDVSFRYVGSFQYYYCSSYLPWLGQSNNPNNWDEWDLTDWLPTWKGKKLLVPRTYQYYHQVVYGFSISSALFLVSNY